MILVGWAFRFGQLKPRWGRFHLLLILFLLQLIISKGFAINAFAAKIQFDMMLVPIVVSIIIVQVVRTEDQIYRVMWFIAFGLGFLGSWALWKSHFTNFYNIEADGELVGPGGQLIDRNDFGLGLNMGLAVVFYLSMITKIKIAKIIAFCSCGPLAITILETGSRGAFLALIAIGLYIMYKLHHKKWLWGIAVVGLIGGISVLPPEQIERISGIKSAASEDTSAQGRITSWKAAIEMARHKPLNGVGLGCFTVDYFRYAPEAEVAFVAHSSFFQILGTAGIPGALLWVMLVVRFWQVCSRLERQVARARLKNTRIHYLVLALKTSHIGYVIAGAFLSMEDCELFYYELGLLASLDVCVQRRLKIQKEAEEESGGSELS
jgi:probable O-glycosylation ligase (exosortase A-associated)